MGHNLLQLREITNSYQLHGEQARLTMDMEAYTSTMGERALMMVEEAMSLGRKHFQYYNDNDDATTYGFCGDGSVKETTDKNYCSGYGSGAGAAPVVGSGAPAKTGSACKSTAISRATQCDADNTDVVKRAKCYCDTSACGDKDSIVRQQCIITALSLTSEGKACQAATKKTVASSTCQAKFKAGPVDGAICACNTPECGAEGSAFRFYCTETAVALNPATKKCSEDSQARISTCSSELAAGVVKGSECICKTPSCGAKGSDTYNTCVAMAVSLNPKSKACSKAAQAKATTCAADFKTSMIKGSQCVCSAPECGAVGSDQNNACLYIAMSVSPTGQQCSAATKKRLSDGSCPTSEWSSDPVKAAKCVCNDPACGATGSADRKTCQITALSLAPGSQQCTKAATKAAASATCTAEKTIAAGAVCACKDPSCGAAGTESQSTCQKIVTGIATAYKSCSTVATKASQSSTCSALYSKGCTKTSCPAADCICKGCDASLQALCKARVPAEYAKATAGTTTGKVNLDMKLIAGFHEFVEDEPSTAVSLLQSNVNHYVNTISHLTPAFQDPSFMLEADPVAGTWAPQDMQTLGDHQVNIKANCCCNAVIPPNPHGATLKEQTGNILSCWGKGPSDDEKRQGKLGPAYYMRLFFCDSPHDFTSKLTDKSFATCIR